MSQTPEDHNRLEDLAAQVMSRSTILTSEQVAGFRVAMARMEGKLDAALALKAEVVELREENQGLALKVNRLEAHMGVLMWVGGVAGIVLAGGIGTLFTFFLNRAAS
jgi:hypothetical protein